MARTVARVGAEESGKGNILLGVVVLPGERIALRISRGSPVHGAAVGCGEVGCVPAAHGGVARCEHVEHAGGGRFPRERSDEDIGDAMGARRVSVWK